MINRIVFRQTLGARTLAGILSVFADTSPAGEEVVTIARLEKLDDIEFVVVLGDVGLIQHAIIIFNNFSTTQPR